MISSLEVLDASVPFTHLVGLSQQGWQVVCIFSLVLILVDQVYVVAILYMCLQLCLIVGIPLRLVHLQLQLLGSHFLITLILDLHPILFHLE